MAKTLTNERSLLRRQDAIARDLAFLKRMRIIEWAVASICLLAGLFVKFALGRQYIPLKELRLSVLRLVASLRRGVR